MADTENTEAEAPKVKAPRKIIRRVGKPLFHAKKNMVVVRPINFCGKAIEVGTVIEPGDYRQHVLRMWYNRSRIGPEGHAWTEAVLKNQEGFPKGIIVEHEGPETDEDVDTQPNATEDATVQTDEPELDLDEDRDDADDEADENADPEEDEDEDPLDA